MVELSDFNNEQNGDKSYDEMLGSELERTTKMDSVPSDLTAHVSPSPPRNQTSRRSVPDYGEVSRRNWQESKRLKLDGDVPDSISQARLPKRKVACLIGYCGTGYHGMQLNPPSKTIESELFASFVKAGAVSEDNADDPKKV